MLLRVLVHSRIVLNGVVIDVPELPDIALYIECLKPRVIGQTLLDLRLRSPFILRTVEPKPQDCVGSVVEDVTRVGKRIALVFSGGKYAVIHLMIAGRLRWREAGATLPKRFGLAAFDFSGGSLFLTEAGTKHRASLHLVVGHEALSQFDRGGVDVFSVSPDAFTAAIRSHNRTLKRALTDPSVVDGVGNAYSDEILHRAHLSPFAQTASLSDGEALRLYEATRGTLKEWIDRLLTEAGSSFPEKVTPFHPEMAVHGKYGKPCPVCGAPVQRIVYAENEANYCAGCQTGGRVLADRSLSRLLKDDWPKTLEDLERLRPG